MLGHQPTVLSVPELRGWPPASDTARVCPAAASVPKEWAPSALRGKVGKKAGKGRKGTVAPNHHLRPALGWGLSAWVERRPRPSRSVR